MPRRGRCNNEGPYPVQGTTDSGAWVIREAEKGKVYIRATLTGEKTEPYYKAWYGTVQTPLLKMDWK